MTERLAGRITDGHGLGCSVQNTLNESDCDCTWRTKRREALDENERLRAALEKLRHCAHACGPAPCPHTRKFEEATRGLLPPRRVTPQHVETGWS